jgi:hypothetical protein
MDFHHQDPPTREVKSEPILAQWAGNIFTQDVFGIKEWGAQRVSKE